jgi:hypothetical protein
MHTGQRLSLVAARKPFAVPALRQQTNGGYVRAAPGSESVGVILSDMQWTIKGRAAGKANNV